MNDKWGGKVPFERIEVTTGCRLEDKVIRFPNIPLKFNDFLKVARCEIRRFDGEVFGWCSFKNSNLKELGENTRFHGNLNMKFTEVKVFNHRVQGDCNVSHSKIEEIGPNAEFGANLTCNYTQLVYFNSKVIGNCDLNGNKFLMEIGPKTDIRGDLFCKNNNKLKTVSGTVGGSTVLRNLPALREISEGAVFMDSLYCVYTSLTEFNGKVDGNCSFKSSRNLERIGNKEFGGNLNCERTAINLKDYAVKVKGDLRINSEVMPERFRAKTKIGGGLYVDGKLVSKKELGWSNSVGKKKDFIGMEL